MTTTANVLTNLGDGPEFNYREMSNQLGIMTTARSHPRCLTPGLRGYYLGMHNTPWVAHEARATAGSTYFVRIVPIFNGLVDNAGAAMKGSANAENTTKGNTFVFDPFPEEYPCDGYQVWAGAVSGTLYLQGTLSNRYSTTFQVAVTWPLVSSGSTLSPLSHGPRPFASALEVYQVEAAADSRLFLGGGVKYSDGYAQVATATAGPTLTGGTAAQSTAATWAALGAAGSFRMRLSWNETVGVAADYTEMFDWQAVDFTGDATMANVAATIQAAIRAAKGPELFGGTDVTTSTTTWQAMGTNGSFQLYTNGTLVQVTGVDVSAVTNMTDVATAITSAWGGTNTCTWDATAGRLIFRTVPGAPTAHTTMSYLQPHAAGTGTDISGLCDARETSSTAVLNKRGKAATTAESVAWSTNKFILTSTATGNQYRLSFWEQATANVGTDISTSSWADLRSNSNLATYVAGTTAKRTVTGTGTAWGDWCEGMKFRVEAEAEETLIAGRYEDNQLLLDADYPGTAAYDGPVPYVLLPYDTILHYSGLGNPFSWNTTDQQLLPVATSDGITAIRRVGTNIAVFMRHHVWMVDGVNITSPVLISSQYGAVNTTSCVEFGGSIFFFTGEEFMVLTGGQVRPLDPQGRVKAILNRLSVNVDTPHGQWVKTPNTDLIKWFFGLDSSFLKNVAVVYEPRTGNFWLHNHKDANCSAVIRDVNETQYLLTGSTYNKGHSVPAFTFVHGSSYKNDGATTDTTKTIQGLIDTVGASTETAGYLTCGANGNAIGAWQSVTAGYFAVTIDDTDYFIGPCDFSGDSDFDDAASTIQTAIRAQTSGTETCTHNGTAFVITSGTTTNRSNVSVLRPYYPTATATSISGRAYMNGETGIGTETNAVNTLVLTLDDADGAVAALNTGADGEKGIWVYICDTNYQNGQYALVSANTATTITITPNPSTAPVAGWHWYLGGIVPSWLKWLDFGSPQHKQRLDAINVTTDPVTSDADNYLAVHIMHDLSTTIRTREDSSVVAPAQIGGSNDVTNTFKPGLERAIQHGIKIERPSSTHDFKIEDITITHDPRV
ncbi:MAG: DUF3383 family protein [Planctomycetota bacterium]|jgi:hypothetical protein